MKKVITELEKLNWGWEEVYDNGIFVNGYQIHEYDGNFEVIDVWSDNLQTKWYKRIKPMLNLVTDR